MQLPIENRPGTLQPQEAREPILLWSPSSVLFGPLLSLCVSQRSPAHCTHPPSSPKCTHRARCPTPQARAAGFCDLPTWEHVLGDSQSEASPNDPSRSLKVSRGLEDTHLPLPDHSTHRTGFVLTLHQVSPCAPPSGSPLGSQLNTLHPLNDSFPSPARLKTQTWVRNGLGPLRSRRGRRRRNHRLPCSSREAATGSEGQLGACSLSRHRVKVT